MAKIKKGVNPKKKGKYEKAVSYFSVLKATDLVEFEYMIQSGITYEEIFKFLQDLGHFEGRSYRTIRDMISLYNNKVLKPKVLATVDTVDIYKELMVLKGKVNSLKEYSVLVVHQKIRLNKIIEMEKLVTTDSDGVITKTGRQIAYQVRSEMKLMGDLLEKLASIQMKTGVLKVAPRFISGEMIKDENDPFKMTFQLREDFMENLDAIEAELIDVVDLEEIRRDVQEEG